MRSLPEKELVPRLTALRSAISARMIVPQDAEYDSARKLFYGWIDRRPAAIVKVTSSKEVGTVVKYAKESGLPLAVRSGGHGFAGYSVCENGIVIDLSGMNRIDIDHATRTAWAETGMTAGQYAAATADHGLATGFGDTGSVGIGGITLGGGIGYLVRKHGMTIDDLLAAEIVTADGRILAVDSENHPDLFWAIRGGGGNFGVATRFKFRLHQVDSVLGGMLILPATADTIVNIVDAAESAPEELSLIANVMTAPPMPFLPPEVHGRTVIMAMVVYSGPLETGEPVLGRIRSIEKPIADMVKPMRYTEIFQVEGPHPTAVSANTMFANVINRNDAGEIVEALKESHASMAVAQLRVLGGAMARVPSDATAFSYRDRRLLANVAALYESPADAPRHDAWVRKLSNVIRKGDEAVYVNFLGDEGEKRVRAAYAPRTYERLASIKKLYDPDNLFRGNHNIPPAI